MRKSNTQKINSILSESLKELNIDTKLKEVQLIKSWEQAVGKTIAKYTDGLYIKNKKLFVKLTSSVVKNELMMIKDGLLNALNDRIGEKIIDDIIFR